MSKSAGLTDISWTTRLDLTGFGLKKGIPFEVKASCWTLGPHHYLVTCDPLARDGVIDELKAFQTVAADLSLPSPVYVTEVTSVYAQLLLAGPRSRAILRKLTSLDVSERSFADLSCGQSNVAHVRAIILRQDLNGVPAFHLLVGRDSAESVSESVLQAGREFDIVLFGLQALEVLNR